MMIPLILNMRVRKEGRRQVSLFLPIFLVWILLLALLLALLPFVLLAALLTWSYGGKMLLGLYPRLFSVLWALSGLHIEVKNEKEDILFDFR
jgi:hypothetical protein